MTSSDLSMKDIRDDFVNLEETRFEVEKINNLRCINTSSCDNTFYLSPSDSL